MVYARFPLSPLNGENVLHERGIGQAQNGSFLVEPSTSG